LKDIDINQYVSEQLQKYAPILESNFHDMVDIEFTVENGEFYILSARAGKRTSLANLKIIMSMFCEGKMTVDDVFTKLPFQHLVMFLDEETLVNAEELTLITSGFPASGGIGIGRSAFTFKEAENCINKREAFVYCCIEVNPEDLEVYGTKYCKGVMTSRGGMTSHAAVCCRGMGSPCVSGFGNLEEVTNILYSFDNQVTIDGNTGKIYAGIGKTKKNTMLPEFKMLYELLKIIIKCNIVNSKTALLAWRLWDVLVLDRRYGENENSKRLVQNGTMIYKSFIHPSNCEIETINRSLVSFENSKILIEDFIGFLFSQLSSEVSLGQHFLYVRPLLDPLKTMSFYDNKRTKNNCFYGPVGNQLTGVEFFNVNHYLDFLIDIANIKIYFKSEFLKTDDSNNEYYNINYLDYTNPLGESLIINTYKAESISVYINDVFIPLENLAMVYHLLRRRAYHWTWYEENNVTKNEIVNYLFSGTFVGDKNSKMFYLCQEMHLIDGDMLTPTGISLLGGLNNGKQ